MSSSTAFELRVLSGMHAGARATLNGEGFSIGSSPDCDFILDDEGIQGLHARLLIKDGKWHLELAAEDGGTEVEVVVLESAKAFLLGPIMVAVDAQDAPWPTLETLVVIPPPLSLDSSLPLPREPEPVSPGMTSGSGHGGIARGLLATLTATLACVSALALVAWPPGQGQPKVDPASTAASASGATVAAALPDTRQKAEIDSVLGELGMSSRAKVEAVNGSWLVRASSMSDTEIDSLSAALARMKPRPGLKATTEQQLRDEVAEALLRIAPEYRGAVSLRDLGGARFKLEGRVAKASDRERLVGMIRAAVPQMRELQVALVTGEENADRFLDELRSNGWDIDSAWEDGVLAMKVRLPRKELPQWELALQRATRVSAPLFRAELAFNTTTTRARSDTETHAPFEIRGVVGGDTPYVLLEHGAMLVQGGVWQGWRLASVSATNVVFENGSRRATIAR